MAYPSWFPEEIYKYIFNISPQIKAREPARECRQHARTHALYYGWPWFSCSEGALDRAAEKVNETESEKYSDFFFLYIDGAAEGDDL